MNPSQIIVQGLGAIAFGFVWYVISRAQRDKDNPIDMAYVLVDTQTKQVTAQSFGMFVSLVVSTFIVLALFVLAQWALLIQAFGLYIATWGAVKVLNDLTTRPRKSLAPEDDDK